MNEKFLYKIEGVRIVDYVKDHAFRKFLKDYGAKYGLQEFLEKIAHWMCGCSEVFTKNQAPDINYYIRGRDGGTKTLFVVRNRCLVKIVRLPSHVADAVYFSDRIDERWIL